MLRQYAPAAGCLLKGVETVLGCSLFARSLGSAALQGSLVPLGDSADCPVLLQLPQRLYGAPADLELEAVQSVLGSRKPSEVAVIRQPFTSFDQAPRPLNQLLRPVAKNALAVASEVAVPQKRLVVDTYTAAAPGGGYHLKSVATCLLRYLKQQGTRVALVPDVQAPRVTSATAVTGVLNNVRQSSNELLMVAPTAFGFNEQAAQDNSFMNTAPKAGEDSSLTRTVLQEFAGLHHQLSEVAGVKVHLFEHSLQHGTPDACFPNNWFSTHPQGEAAFGVKESTLVLYPMKHPNRAAERRQDIIKVLQTRAYAHTYDMSPEEKNGHFFEGTGVLVIDRINGVVYVDLSERADEYLAEQWTKHMGYNDLVTFRSTDVRGKSVYHTNVMMAIGSGVAIVCAESVADPQERERLVSALQRTHEVVEISLQQMDQLCGNALEVQDFRGLPVMAMSTQAYNAFTEAQRQAIRRHVADIVHAPIDTLEKVGGGSVRCTLAELF